METRQTEQVALAPSMKLRTLAASMMPDVAAGSLSAVVTLSYAISYGVLVFSGPELRPYVPVGVHSALIAAWVVALVVALGSSFQFAIAGPDSNATAILAVMASSLAAGLAPRTLGEQIATSVLLMLAASAVLGGLLVGFLGVLRCGHLVRFLPYPVAGGFLAGTGLLVVAGGFQVLAGVPLAWEILHSPPAVPMLGWTVTTAVAAALLVLPRFCKHFLVTPLVILVGVLMFYLSLQWSGMSIDEARTQGLMFMPIETPHALLPSLPALAGVEWMALASQWEHFLAMLIVMIVTILLNATGLELATQHDVDFDRELRINGLANVASGFLGGMIGYLSLSRSLLNFKAGGRSRWASIWTALLCLGATFAFSAVIAYFPRPVLAGLLLFVGLSLLREWVWDTYFRLPLLEYALIIGILLLIAYQGLLTGVMVGLMVAFIFFVYSYGRTQCIKHSFASGTHFSNKDRSLVHMNALRERGKAARALCLQGYLFFGTASGIVETCKNLIAREGVRYLLLDFRMVQGLDASAMLSLTKLEQICVRSGVRLLLSGLRPELEQVLKQAQFLPSPTIPVFADVDRGLEWIEDSLLESTDAGAYGLSASAPTAGTELRSILAADFTAEALDVLIGFCEELALPEKTPLCREGDAGDALYFVEHGEVSVLLCLPDGQILRVKTMGPGTVVGEMALYSNQPRSADVVTDTACRLRKFSLENFLRMERDYPVVARQFHSFVVRLLATRLAAANAEIEALL